MKLSFIAWTRFHRRSEILAQELGASLHYVYSGKRGRPFRPPLGYLVQGLRVLEAYLIQARQTWCLLNQERPNVIFVQNPPIFSVLVAFLYARRHGAQFVIDSHTGAFLSPKWRWSVGLHRLLSRQALLTIVHNRSQEEILKRWGCRYSVLAFTPGDYPVGDPFPLINADFNIAMVSSFNSDEPHDVVFEAARRLSDCNIYITGDPERASHLMTDKPENCHLTGYLTYERYVGLLRGVDAIIVLTTGDHQMLMGGFEAVSLGKPLIISDWPLLKDYFCLGTVHIPNTAEGVCQGVCQAQRDRVVLQQEILALREQLQTEYEERFLELRGLLEEQV